jgi:hypothetical protein
MKMNVELVTLLGKLEHAHEDTMKLAQKQRNGTQAQKRLLAAFSLIRKAQDEITIAGAGL